jgi:hypothetical protein
VAASFAASLAYLRDERLDRRAGATDMWSKTNGAREQTQCILCKNGRILCLITTLPSIQNCFGYNTSSFIYFLVEDAYTQQGRAHTRRLHPDWAARPALMRRAAHAVESDFGLIMLKMRIQTRQPDARLLADLLLLVAPSTKERLAQLAALNPLTPPSNGPQRGEPTP